MFSPLEILRLHPELTLFLALAVGHLLGKIKIRQFEIGPVTGTLIAAILIGQMKVSIEPSLGSFFFLIFIFSVGYSVGPQAIKGLKYDGTPQLLFAVAQCVVSVVVVYCTARVLGMDAGASAGLLAGSHTTTAALGVAADTIRSLPASPPDIARLVKSVSVAYAITYFFGTAGASWFLARFGPKILGVDLPTACKDLEKKRATTEASAHTTYLAERVDVRAYRLDSARYAGRTIRDIESELKDKRVFIEGVRRGVELVPVSPETVLMKDDVVAVMARLDVHASGESAFGREVDDQALVRIPVEIIDVVVTNGDVVGKSLTDLAASTTLEDKTRSVFVRKILRAGVEMPITPTSTLDQGDILQLIGPSAQLDMVGARVGYVDKPTTATDMVLLSAGIFVGGYLGSITMTVGHLPLQLSAPVGALLAGLLLGWLRSVKRTVGRIPSSALWILSNLGLSGFIATLGLQVGPEFFQSLREMGVSLLLTGVVATLTPLVAGLLLGRYVFKFHPIITLGATAGAQTSAASLASIQEAGKSKTPALAYPVPYAVANILLTIWGSLIVILISRN